MANSIFNLTRNGKLFPVLEFLIIQRKPYETSWNHFILCCYKGGRSTLICSFFFIPAAHCYAIGNEHQVVICGEDCR